MTLVVKEGETWFRVAVHRAVIMPLCTLLREIEKDVNREDHTVILPDVPLELLEALIRLVYKGFAPLSEVVTVDSLLLLMRMLGLPMPAERMIVTREKVEEEVEIIGFKNLYGLEIFETKAGMERESLPTTERRRSLEITPCGTSATQESKKRRSRRQVPSRSSKSRDFSRSTSDLNDNLKPNAESGEAVEGINVSMMPLQVKLECEDVEDISQRSSRKIHREECEVSDIAAKKRRRKSTIPTLACELCDFKCRFVKDMQKHYDENHCNNENLCTICGFKASTIGGLRVHSARKHNVSKNTVKVFEGDDKLAEAEQVASNDETIANNNCEVNLAKDNNVMEKEEYSVDDDKVSMTLECINAKESVKAIIVGNEIKKDCSVVTLSSSGNALNLDAAISATAKNKDNSDINSNTREAEISGANIGKGEVHDESVNKMVENSYDSFAASAIKDNEDGNDENSSVELVNNEKFGKNILLSQVDDDPLTILKNVKAAHVKERVNASKGSGNKTVKPKKGVETKKGALKDAEEIGTDDVNNYEKDNITEEKETNMM